MSWGWVHWNVWGYCRSGLSDRLAELDGVPVGIVDLHLIHSPRHRLKLVAEFGVSGLQILKQLRRVFDSDITAAFTSNFSCRLFIFRLPKMNFSGAPFDDEKRVVVQFGHRFEA